MNHCGINLATKPYQNNKNMAFSAVKNALIVDDDELQSDSLKDLLEILVEKHGDTLKETIESNAEDAIQTLEKNKFNIVITDGHTGSKLDKKSGTGEGDGLKVVEAALEKKYSPDQIMMISGDATLEAPVTGKYAHFITKGSPAQVIIEKLTKILYGEGNELPVKKKTIYA